METIKLAAQSRDKSSPLVRAMRKAGRIPAVIYGNKIESISLDVSALDFKKVFTKAGESTVITVDVDGGKSVNAIIQDVQLDPLSGAVSHIDFFQVRMDEKIEATIPLEFVGESKAIKEMGGVLVKSIDEIEVSCLPADLPHAIEVNLAAINNFDDHIKVKDLAISDKVKVLTDIETVVALVEAPRTEEDLAELNEKVEADVTKVQGTVKEVPVAEEKAEEKAK
ncbi:50S ribosomal protein L25 [Patescibacteria group bacterium]|nr:MAG: 50S ribosomal protein L25 [Patescibacteria group bacterium]